MLESGANPSSQHKAAAFLQLFLLSIVHKFFIMPQATFQGDNSFILSMAATLLVFQTQYKNTVETLACLSEAGTDVRVRSKAQGVSVGVETTVYKTTS